MSGTLKMMTFMLVKSKLIENIFSLNITYFKKNCRPTNGGGKNAVLCFQQNRITTGYSAALTIKRICDFLRYCTNSTKFLKLALLRLRQMFG